ncbi:MAG: PQQ-binding-like beta-propeller repeat protein, partial [Thermoguttaceae bacterium]
MNACRAPLRVFFFAAAIGLLFVGQSAGEARKRPLRPLAPPSVSPAALAAAWDLQAPVRPFDDVCFEDRSILGGLSQQQALRYWEPAPGHALNLTDGTENYHRLVRFRGLAKLKPAWTPDMVLRLSHTGQSLRVYFWGDHEGVVLDNYAVWPAPRWAAYRSRCRPGEPYPGPQPGAPPIVTVLTSEDQRTFRTTTDTVEIRCQDGAVVLSQGDVRLLTAPCAETPRAVYLEARQDVALRDLALGRSTPIPDDPPQPHSLVLGGGSPGSLAWKPHVTADAHFERLSDGRVELSAPKNATPAWITVRPPRPGLYEVILQVENASPGSGVFLADDAGQPLVGLEFLRDQRTGWLGVNYGKPASGGWITIDTEHGLMAAVGTRQWLRLVLAGGMVRCWTSGDGKHWGQLLSPQVQAGAWREIGLYLQSGEAPHRIQLRALEVRALDGLTNLAPAELQDAALRSGATKAGPTDIELGAWQQQVAEHRPAGATPAAWRFACALQTLAAGPDTRLGKPLLEKLLYDGLGSLPSLEARLRLLQDSALVYDTWTSLDEAHRYAAHWQRVGRSLLADGAGGDFDLYRRSAATVSLWHSDHRVETLTPRFVQDRFLTLLAQQRLDALRQWCRQVRFCHQPGVAWMNWPGEQESLQRLAEWIEADLGMAAGGREGRPAAGLESAWRRPISVQLNREAYNTLSELQTAVDEGLYDEAAHLLATAVAPGGDGLVPDDQDPQQFTSYAAAVKLIIQRHVKLAEAIQRHLGAAEKLRIEQTIALGDAAAIRAITLQYCGTPAAAAAHLWLGDRCLSQGDFDRALAHYREALPGTAATQREQLSARVRLASAMRGREVGQPPAETIAFGDARIAPAEFEQWTADALRRYRQYHGSGDARAAALSPDVASAPVRFDAQPWSKLEGDVGQHPEQVPAVSQGTDWPARQAAAVIARDLMIVANRFQVAAIGLSDGKRRWTCSLGGEQGNTHSWPLLPMRPVILENRLFVRLLPASDRPEIVCLDLAGGKQLWRRGGGSGRIVADPLVLCDRLFALLIDSQQDLTPQLVLAELDQQSGDVLRRTSLFTVRSPWAESQAGQATVVADRIVVSLAGSLFCVDADASVAWLRSASCMPPSIEPAPGQEYSQPPLAAGGRLYVTHPGARSIECLDQDTGRLCWRRTSGGIRRWLDAVDGRLLVQTTDGIVALDCETGQTLWGRTIPRLAEGYARAGPGLLLCAQHEPLSTGSECPVLVWLDSKTGATRARTPLWNLRGKQAMLGPLVVHGKDLWALATSADERGLLQPQMDIVALRPAGAAAAELPEGDFWVGDVGEGLQAAARLTLPGWTVLAAPNDEGNGVRAQWNGAENVLATRAAALPARLARRLAVPVGRGS